jgi:GNAT superfamily N-acetyltransferase
MEQTITFRMMQRGEEALVSEMVLRAFDKFVAPDLTDEGVQEIRGFVAPDQIQERIAAGRFILVAQAGTTIAGMIEMRDFSHVTLLFVDEKFQRQGIARELLRRAVDMARKKKPSLTAITVASSSFAVEAYQRLGFESNGPEFTKNGVTAYPMILNVEQWRSG